MDTPRACSIDGCGGEYRAKGYCFRHYMQMRRTGNPLGTTRKPRKPCSVDGCGALRHARGFCRSHYRERIRLGAFADMKKCGVADCDAGAEGLGYCAKHAMRLQRWGSVDTVKKPPKGQGRGCFDRKGYWIVQSPGHPNAGAGGSIRQHVLVMSAYLGRPLRKGETVHHKNGVRHDNRLENLELWVSVHPSGQRVTDLVAFAREILDRYGEEVDRCHQ